MANITDHYEITRDDVPFEDVELTTDNLLFVDPRAVRLSPGPEPFKTQALSCIDTFTSTILDFIRDGSPDALERGKQLLESFGEPSETRLGMTVKGVQGHGGAKKTGGAIWDALTGDARALVRVGVLHQLEAIPLFVEGVGNDITSDITTRIIFQPLAEYTFDMMTKFPSFRARPHKTLVVERQAWDRASSSWTTREFELPAPEGKPLLLVPKPWARPQILMTAGRYRNTSVCDYVQLEQAALGANGKLIKTPKHVLRKQPQLCLGRKTNIDITLRACNNGEDLVREFESFVASKLELNTARGARNSVKQHSR